MLGENILDDTHPETHQFTDCKIKYLVAENKIMTTQLSSISTLVDKYKKIIDLLSKSQISESTPTQVDIPKPQQSHLEINSILHQTEQVIQKCIEDCKEISNAKNIFQEQEGTVTPAFFAELVLSYQKAISNLKHSIHQRQILLQQLQSTPNHPMKRHPHEQSESSAVVKAIQSYDIYPKISEKCRKEILELKTKKKQLELLNSVKQSTHSRKSSPCNTSEFQKTVRKVPQYASNPRNSEENTQIEVESMSPFEKTILIYKKKKIFNDILEAKVIEMKKKIKEKQLCNQILKKRLENQVWDNIENINQYGRNLEQDDPAFLSMLNQSIRANNLDFSVDISRVMPGIGKTEAPVNLQNILSEVDQEKETVLLTNNKHK